MGIEQKQQQKSSFFTDWLPTPLLDDLNTSERVRNSQAVAQAFERQHVRSNEIQSVCSDLTDRYS